MSSAWLPEYPPVAGADFLAYTAHIKPWRMMREKGWTLGSRWFPYVPAPWGEAVVTSVSDNGDGTSTIHVDADPWHGLGQPDPTVITYAPTVFAVVLDSKPNDPGLDPWQVVKLPLMVSVSGTTVTAQGRVGDYVTSGQIPSLSSLVGRSLLLTRTSPWWHEKWPQWAPAHRHDVGTITTASSTVLTLAAKHFAVADSLAGSELIARDVAGKLHRVAVSHNANNSDNSGATITLATSTPNLAGNVAIITAGQMFLPEQVSCQPHAYYTGNMGNGFYSHDAPNNDALDLAPTPTITVSFSNAEDPDFCDPPSVFNIWLNDLYSNPQNACGAADDPKNLYVTRCLSWLQAALRGLVGSYLAPGWSSATKSQVQRYVLATAFRDAGINAFTGTTGSLATGGISISLSGTLPDTGGDPLECFYALIDTDGVTVTNSGSSQIISGVLTGGFVSPDDEGKSLVVSLGESRFYELTFARFHETLFWIPDFDPDSDAPGAIIYPPREPNEGETEGPGKWVTIPASTHCLTAAPYGLVSESTLNVDQFQSGQLIRQVGENFRHPTTTWAPDDAGGMPPVTPFYDRGYAGMRSEPVEAKLEKSRSGYVASATTTQLTVLDADWYSCDFTADYLETTLSGTATISGTSLSDPSQSSSGFWTASPSWLVGQTVEARIGTDAEGEPVYFSSLVTAQSGTTLTLSDSVPTTATGSYRIRPASPRNRWKGRTLTIYHSETDGTTSTHSTVIQGNSDSVLFFSVLAFTPSRMDRVYISDPRPDGSVWKWNGSAFVRPTGMDTVRRGVTTPASFDNLDQKTMLATVTKRYGLFLPGDDPIAVRKQIYQLANVLKVLPFGGYWTASSSDSDTSPAVNNVAGGTGEAYGAECTVCLDPHNVYIGNDGLGCSGGTMTEPTDMYSYVAQQWSGSRSGGTHTVVDGMPPQSNSGVQICGSDGVFGCGVSASATAAHYRITPQTYGGLTHTTAYWDFGQINAGDIAPQTGGPDTETIDGDTFTTCDETIALACTAANVAYHAWTQWGTSSGSGSLNEYSPLLGNTTQPQPLPFTTCDSPDNGPCNKFSESYGGYYVAAATAALTPNYTYYG